MKKLSSKINVNWVKTDNHDKEKCMKWFCRHIYKDVKKDFLRYGTEPSYPSPGQYEGEWIAITRQCVKCNKIKIVEIFIIKKFISLHSLITKVKPNDDIWAGPEFGGPDTGAC